MGARTLRVAKVFLLAVAAVLYALHFVHLRADFPNHSPWTDWAKYTDEGWYGLAAIRHYQLGHWSVPGDFNPAAALPVWPLLEAMVFRFTGVSLLAARALTVTIFGLTMIFSYLLVRRWADQAGSKLDNNTRRALSLAPAVAVLLMAASPFYFAFSRLAILEPLMVLLALACLHLAERAGAAATVAWGAADSSARLHNRQLALRAIAWCALLGIALAAMVLTKTTGLFLAPAVACMLWAGCAYRVPVMLRAAAVTCAAAAGTWGGYMLLFVRPHYLADYRYLFSANGYTGITRDTVWPVVVDTILAGQYLGVVFFWLAAAAAFMAIVTIAARRFRGDALSVSLLLWIASYFAFLAYHDNLQARYYYALGVPLTMLIAISLTRLWQLATSPSALRNLDAARWTAHGLALRTLMRIVACAACVAVAFVVVRGAALESVYAFHPEYTFLSAANQVHNAIERQRSQDRAAARPMHPEMTLSISGAALSLMTRLPSICDDFGTMTLAQRISTYRPGWFVAWNDVEDDKMEALAPLYRLVKVGEWPAFDDPDRNLVVLYRLDPLQQQGLSRGRNRRRLNIPRRLRRRAAPSPRAK
ncbi:MAG TPA: hypothetical protein VII58_13050 [Acidobacteriaceae bacterium]